jgi:hypothetical protein
MSLSDALHYGFRDDDKTPFLFAIDVRNAVRALKTKIISGSSNEQKFKIIDEIFGEQLT